MGVQTKWEDSLSRVGEKAQNTVRQNWHLGFTGFGGPPVHFKIFHDKFTKKLQWIDEQLYQELFTICQALSGPGSTKMHYCINLIHDGLPSAILGFFIWSLPGALGMYGLAVGISNVSENLPRAVYALLSGLNAATVGVIVQAAVELSEKAVTDKMTRIIVFFTACAGMLYNALWYFPVLVAGSGLVTVIYEKQAPVREEEGVEMQVVQEHQAAQRTSAGSSRRSLQPPQDDNEQTTLATEDEPRVIPTERRLNMSWKVGLAVIASFLVSFTVVMILRGVLPYKPLLYRLFANMYLAGTIIFGGGPVVIPLLREYVVAEGWVSPRDFLIGLAIIQAFPGPNFNFAVYLGALTASNDGENSAVGALLAYIGIFLPGLWSVHGTLGVWSAIRGLRYVKSTVRGMNAGAVGLIYTAVYRLWQIGYIDEGYRQGTSLAVEPWWVVVTATSFVGGRFFGVSPWVVIIIGAVMGLIWYGVVTA
jgi:chromate transport protein ChrA